MWPVIIHECLRNSEYASLLQKRKLKIRVSESAVPGSLIFPMSRLAFMIVSLSDVLEAGSTVTVDANIGEMRVKQDLIDKLDKFIEVHQKCYVICTAPMFGPREQQNFALLQRKYLFTRLRFQLAHNVIQGVEAMVTIAKALCKPMIEDLNAFLTSMTSNHVTDVVTSTLKFLGLNDHQCDVLTDGLGSLANVATATKDQLMDCSLDSDTAAHVFNFFSSAPAHSEE